MPVLVAKFPAGSVALTVTLNVPLPFGVVHKSFGLPRPTYALFVQTVREPWRTVRRTVEIFDSETCTPARVPPFSFVVSSEMTGGVFS